MAKKLLDHVALRRFNIACLVNQNGVSRDGSTGTTKCDIHLHRKRDFAVLLQLLGQKSWHWLTSNHSTHKMDVCSGMFIGTMMLPTGTDHEEPVMRYGVATLVFCAAIAGVFSTRPAGAVKPFLEQFKALYVKPKTTDHAMQIFNVAVEKKACSLCHLGNPTKPKKELNAYGTPFKKLLTKRDGQDSKKVRAAMGKVARMKSNPDDPDSPTFGERLKEGKLPVGEIHVRSKDASQ